MGKFARLAVGTRHVDYNGRLCMVSAGVAYKLAFGVDRSPIPWSDIPKADVLFIIGSNIGDCSPITTDYVWRCRDRGGKLIVADPRLNPISRNADLFLPVRPGTDLALLMGMLHVILRDGLENREFIEEHTTGFEAVKESVAAWDPRTVAEKTGVPPENIEKAAHWFAKADRAIALHARGLEHQSKGVENCLAVINIALATGHLGREGCGLRHDHGPGQRAGRTRAWAEVRSTSRPAHAYRSRRARACCERLGYLAGRVAAARLQRRKRSWRRFIAERSRHCFACASIPWFRCRDSNYTREALEKLEFFGVIDFFMSETAQHADVVLAGSLQEEEEGLTCNVEGRVIHIQKAVDPPGNARTRHVDSVRTGAPPGSRKVLSVRDVAPNLG